MASLLLPFLIPMIIFQRFENIILGFFIWDSGRNELPEPFRLKRELLLLIWLFFAHDGFYDLRCELAVLGKLLHLDCLGE